jgi:hypothetical protein
MSRRTFVQFFVSRQGWIGTYTLRATGRNERSHIVHRPGLRLLSAIVRNVMCNRSWRNRARGELLCYIQSITALTRPDHGTLPSRRPRVWPSAASTSRPGLGLRSGIGKCASRCRKPLLQRPAFATTTRRRRGSVRWYDTDHHGRNNASPRCQARVGNESACCPETYWPQRAPHVTVPGSLAKPAPHLLRRGHGRGEARFRRNENGPRCRPAPRLPYATRTPV